MHTIPDVNVAMFHTYGFSLVVQHRGYYSHIMPHKKDVGRQGRAEVKL